MSNKSPMTVTSITELKKYAEGIIVRLPDFAEGQPFVARIRRPSMLKLAESGRIPNTLLTQAGKLFAEGSRSVDTEDEDMLSQLSEVTRIICEASLIEPTLAQIGEAGIELTDEQVMAIFSYAQNGIKALESFRAQ